MQAIDVHHDFSAQRDQIWDLLQDFGNIERWWPKGQIVNIERVDIEGQGIGMIRHIYNEGFDDAVSEQLISIDPRSYTYTLAIVGKRPAGLTRYQATGTLSQLSEHGSRLSYHSEFQTEPGREQEARAFLSGAYALMFEGLRQATT
ncbi:SRPBCC family protein [Aestuariicella hydrocarbonica]|uniref:SRPBCC family protein n=1 Tax=Pseudomaricurvus hydrocarbonicus TaxID=1470433 RepID=A0A9E5K137_9GAMM|nr:SRPBCC family protein [Aestuariicella hydrocarbonica]NHO66857.1 SRPBCC family protein [Aestuariicella hydrocarbonica]